MSFKLRFRYQLLGLARMLETAQLPEWMFSLKMRLFVFTSIVAFAVGYLFQINNLSTSGYVIHTLENEVAAANEETRKLATEVATYQSMASIQRRLTELSMINAENVTFLKASHDTAMAR